MITQPSIRNNTVLSNTLRVSRIVSSPLPALVNHPHHRNGNPKKSQWSITTVEEVAVFANALAEGWFGTTAGWGLHPPGSTPLYLGVAVDRAIGLFIARFVVSARHADWHGYPFDHRDSAREGPPAAVLNAWLASRLLTAAKIRKIVRGQRCSL